MDAINFLFNAIIQIIFWVVVIQAVLSWLFVLNILSPHQRAPRQVYDALHQLTEPLFAPLRRYIPPVGGLDLTPVVVLLGLQFVQLLWHQYVYM